MQAVDVETADGILAIFIGGFDETGNLTDRIQIFNASSGVWLNASKRMNTTMCSKRRFHAMASVPNPGYIYIAGGSLDTTCGTLTDTLCFIDVRNFSNWIWLDDISYGLASNGTDGLGELATPQMGMSSRTVFGENCTMVVFTGGGIDMLNDMSGPYAFYPTYNSIYTIYQPIGDGKCLSYYNFGMYYKKRSALQRVSYVTDEFGSSKLVREVD
jgi:hypothetical protein